MTSKVIEKKKERQEERFFISSLEADAAQHLHIIRDHWGIENGLHWILDCTYNEDKAGIRLENAALNLSALRKLAMNIFNALNDEKVSIKSMQRKCWNPKNALDFLLKFYHA